MKTNIKIALKELDKFLKENSKNEEFQTWNSVFYTPLFKNIYVYICVVVQYYLKQQKLTLNFYQSPIYYNILALIFNLVLKAKNNVTSITILNEYELFSNAQWKENYYYGLKKETYYGLNRMQDYIFSIIKYLCYQTNSKKDFTDLWTLIANFIEICFINEETPYITKKILWFYKKDIKDLSYADAYINAQIQALDKIKNLLRNFLKDHLNDIILLINSLNTRQT